MRLTEFNVKFKNMTAKVTKKTERMYVGIDFSKEKFNACLRMNGCVVGECELPNTKQGFQQLYRWVKKTSCQGRDFDYSQVLFCGEHTGFYSIDLSEWLYAKGCMMWLENALMIKYGSGFQRGKSDKADAESIASYAERFYEEGKTLLFTPESTALKNLRSLYRFRERTVHDRVSTGNALKSKVFEDSPLAQRQMKARHSKAIENEKEILREMKHLMEESPELAENYRILTSFKGVGPITAAVFLIYTSNFTRFTTPRQFACYCGVAPFGKQSGTSVSTKPHVSRFAHISVKAALVEAAKSAMRTNPVIRRYAEGLRKRGKEEGLIVNNVKNKIIHILFKMVHTHTTWDDSYAQNHCKEERNDDMGKGTSVESAEKKHEKHRRGCASAWGPALGPQERHANEVFTLKTIFFEQKNKKC